MTSEILAALPSEWLTELEQAIIQIDMPSIQKAQANIDQVRPSLSKALARLIDNYEYDEILHVIQEAKQ